MWKIQHVILQRGKDRPIITLLLNMDIMIQQDVRLPRPSDGAPLGPR